MTSDPGENPRSGRPSLVNSLAGAITSTPALRPLGITGLFLMACVGVFWVARMVFIPLTFALMLSFVFRPVIRLFDRARIPSAIGASFVVLALVAGVGFGVSQLANPAVTWAERLPQSLRNIERKIRPLKKPVGKVSALAESVERITDIGGPRTARQVRVEEPSFVFGALETVMTLVGGAIVMTIALYFLLIWGDGLLARLIAFVPDLRSQKRTSDVLRAIEERMSSYLGTICIINLFLGMAVAVVLTVLKMPNALLWGVLAACVNFVPYLGSLVGVFIVGMAALVSFPTLIEALWPPLAYLILTVLEGNVITPIILGRTFRVSPLVIFVWLLFWAWLWGVPGGVLAVPLLMLVKITCEQSPTLAPIAEFLRR